MLQDCGLEILELSWRRLASEIVNSRYQGLLSPLSLIVISPRRGLGHRLVARLDGQGPMTPKFLVK